MSEMEQDQSPRRSPPPAADADQFSRMAATCQMALWQCLPEGSKLAFLIRIPRPPGEGDGGEAGDQIIWLSNDDIVSVIAALLSIAGKGRGNEIDRLRQILGVEQDAGDQAKPEAAP